MNFSGKITSIFFVGFSLGSMAVLQIMGQLIVQFGAASSMVAAFCSILIAARMFFLFKFKHHAIPASPPQISINGKFE
jgi:hypothetical protein